MYCSAVGCWQIGDCPIHGPIDVKAERAAEQDAGVLKDSIVKVDKLKGHFHILGLQLAKKRYLVVGLGTSNSLRVGLVPFDISKDKPEPKGPEPGLLSVARLILRMARSAHLFSSEMELAGFTLVRINVSVSGIGFAIPAANATLVLKPSGKAVGPPPTRPLLSRVMHSPLDLLRNLSQQALALADNFRAVGFELGSLSSSGGWLRLTVGTTFGISVSVLPVATLLPLTHDNRESASVLPVKHLTAFQSVLLSLLLRANKTVSFLLGGSAEVGMITLKVDRLGANIPRLVAKVTCVSKLTDKVVPNPQGSHASEVEVEATSEQVESLQNELSQALTTENVTAPLEVDEKGETFIQEMEEIHAQPPIEGDSSQNDVLCSAGAALIGAGKKVGGLFTGAAQAIVGGLGKSLGAVQSVLHKNNTDDSAKDMVDMGKTVGSQVRRHGFRLAYPDWLEITIGTVVGCDICVEPIPQDEEPVAEEKDEAPPSGQAAALLKMFGKAVKSVEQSASTLRQNNASLNSLDLSVDNVGLGIPELSVEIGLDRK